MSINVRRFGNSSAPPIVFIAGFGDHGGMFDALGSTELGERFAILGVDLPGTGQSKPIDERLTLAVAANLVAEVVNREAAEILVGHSVGSIVASLTASTPGTSITTLLSIEGNLTLADAYFSGSAAQYNSAQLFRTALLKRLDERAVDNPTIGRYRQQVALADPQSIWEMGCDTDAWSRAQVPGEVLTRSARNVQYLYNPDNTPQDSIDWLGANELSTTLLPGASHWHPVDAPDDMAQKLLHAMAV